MTPDQVEPLSGPADRLAEYPGKPSPHPAEGNDHVQGASGQQAAHAPSEVGRDSTDQTNQMATASDAPDSSVVVVDPDQLDAAACILQRLARPAEPLDGAALPADAGNHRLIIALGAFVDHDRAVDASLCCPDLR